MSKKNPDTSIADIAEAINQLATSMDERFDKVDDRFDKMDDRFDKMDDRFDKMDDRFDKIEGRVGNVESKLDSIDAEVKTISREQREMREWMERIDNRLMGVESDIKEIYDRLVALEKKFPNVTEAEVREVQRKQAILIDWANKFSKQHGIPAPKI